MLAKATPGVGASSHPGGDVEMWFIPEDIISISFNGGVNPFVDELPELGIIQTGDAGRQSITYNLANLGMCAYKLRERLTTKDFTYAPGVEVCLEPALLTDADYVLHSAPIKMEIIRGISYLRQHGA